LIGQGISRRGRPCPQSVHRWRQDRSTAARGRPVARPTDRRKRLLAERDCGAANRATGRRADRKLSGADADRGDPDQTEPAGAEDDPKPSWGDPAKSRLPSTLEAQIPQRIWFRGRCFGQPRRRPLCVWVQITARPRPDPPRTTALLRPDSAAGFPGTVRRLGPDCPGRNSKCGW